ncbi:MAG: poly-beta-1,6-N-acetyl-D-glucosamine biosynthesis protein PgaD [Thermodesulfobacteriota bacterium]|nr:poly-beta-1,6-N-acetyl-D-glucosamine biosynthesis protein PgaD [Thermodesulfobacteriota bacterium]
MGKSGQRITHPQIIDKSELKSPLRYLIEGAVTIFLWSLWVYWISPILTLILWFFGIRFFYSEFFLKSGIGEVIHIMKDGGLVVLIITAVMLVWIYYNYLWFLKRGERRVSQTFIHYDKEFAQIFNIELDRLQKAKQTQRLEVNLTDGTIQIK